MKFFKFIGLFILMVLALVLNIIEGLILAISYPLRGLDYVGHKVFKKTSEWTLAAAKRFNFLSVFKE